MDPGAPSDQRYSGAQDALGAMTLWIREKRNLIVFRGDIAVSSNLQRGGFEFDSNMYPVVCGRNNCQCESGVRRDRLSV